MNQTILRLSFFILALVITIQYVQAVDIESAKEISCTAIKEKASLDLEWLMSVKKWQYVQMSRFKLYATVAYLTGKDPKELNEDKVYYESCINWRINFGKEVSYKMRLFGDHEATLVVKPMGDSGAVEVLSDDGKSYGISYTTLTDNKSFIFAVACFTDSNQMGWSVASPYKSLPKETIKLIHDHAESLGFKKEHFTSLRHDFCDKKGQAKNEL